MNIKILKVKLFTTILLLSFVFAFSSCEDDKEEWTDAKIEYMASVPVSPNGVIRQNFNIG